MNVDYCWFKYCYNFNYICEELFECLNCKRVCGSKIVSFCKFFLSLIEFF